MSLRKIGLALATSGLFLFGFGASVFGVYKLGLYLPGQEVVLNCSGIVKTVDVSLETADGLTELAQHYKPVALTISTKSKDVELYSVYDYTYRIPDNQSFADWVKRTPIQIDVDPTLDRKCLAEYLRNNMRKSVDAEITFDDVTGWQLHKEKVGLDIDVDKAIDSVDGYTLNLEEARAYPTVTVEDLKSSFDDVAWLNDFSIKYTNGATIDGRWLSQFVENYTLVLEEDTLRDYLKEALATAYDTASEVVDMELPEAVQVRRKTLRKTLNLNKETKEVLSLIDERSSQSNRTPVMQGYEELGDTYVAVSIEQQHLWYYKDGELVDETDVVTGRLNKHDTPTGAYYITECIPGKYLVGDTYKTWVNQWMRLTNSGIGLHDAYWRSSFGGSVYTYNGSHGCVNIPKDFAKMLYKESYVGMPVVIF